MTIEEAKMRAKLYSALAEGKTIQVKNPNGTWEDIKIEGLNKIYDCNDYRIKPEPNYRPFKNQKECWNEMDDHYPFGWIKAPNGELFCIDKVFDEGVVYKHSSCRFEEYLEGNYTFADGTPFGIIEE